MKKFAAILLTLALLLSIGAASADELTTIKVGATTSPHAEVLEYIKDDMAALGYDLQIVEFTDYNLPNDALVNGEIGANYFQHLPFLNAYNATVAEDKQLVAAIPVHYEPYGIYAGKCKSLDELADGATVTITNDPSNETRALFLLKDAGLITLPEDATVEGSSLTVLDIVDNPKHLNILEVEANTLPSTLDDADVAVINGNFALAAGLSPAKDALFLEPTESDSGKTYTNYVVIRQDSVDAPWVEALRSCLQSDKVRDYMLNNEKYAGGVIPAF